MNKILKFLEEKRIEKKHMDKYISKDSYYQNLMRGIKAGRKQNQGTIQMFYDMCLKLEIDVSLDEVKDLFEK